MTGLQLWLPQGLIQQMLAADELMKRGWRLHTQLNAWFRQDGDLKVRPDTCSISEND